MANEAERVVVEILAKVDGFDGKVRQSASTFGGEMKRVEDTATKAENTVGKSMAGVATATDKAGKAANNAGKEWVRASSEAGKLRQAQLGQAAAADRAAASTELATRAASRNAQSSRLLGYQISDIGTQLAAGTSPFLILAQQGPQVANALDGAKGKVGQFAAFLSGPWGAAILGATTLLGVFGSKLFETGESVDDLVEKLKEQARKTADADKANDLFGQTLEGVAKAADGAEKAVEALRLAEKGQAEQTVESIKKNLDDAEALREKTRARLADLKAIAAIRDAEASHGANTPDELINRELEASRASKAVKALEDDLKAADTAAERLRKSFNIAVSYRTVEQENAGAEEKINRRFDAQIDGAARAANASAKAQEALRKEIARINEAREAELKRYRDTERERNKRSKDGATLPAVTGREIARALGAPITSGARTAAENKAAGGAANSYHLSGQAIDIPLTVNGRPLTKAGIRAALEPLGVQIKELLGPGDKGHSDHFHIAFNKKRLGPDQVAGARDRAAEAAERAADEELRRRQAFVNELASMQGQEIDSRQALVVAAEQIAKLETEAIELSRKKYDDNLNSLVEQEKLTADEAKELRALNDERAKLRTELVQRREDQRKFRMQEADAQAKMEFAVGSLNVEDELLQSQEGIATTAKERRELGERLIDLEFQEERIQNNAVIASAGRLEIEMERLRTLRDLSDAEKAELQRAQDAAKLAEQRNSTQGERKSNAQTGNNRQNASPMQSWFESIPDTAAEIDESLEAIAAGGLNSLADGIADAIVNFKSLGDVARSVLQMILSELIKVIVKMLIMKVLKTVLGLSEGGPVGGEMGGHSLGSGMSRGGRVGYPTGGHVIGAGTATSDSIPAMLSSGEFVIRKKAVDGLGLQALNEMNRSGRLPGAYSDGGLVRNVSPSNAAAATSGGTPGGMDPALVSRLESAVARAAEAMPDVNLFPTLDPAAAFQAGLNSTAGQRKFFEFLSANSTRANQALSR